MMRYGLPYKGSKSAIAEWVVDILPSADVLIDLFAGGCAVTHCAMLQKKYKRYIVNDITNIPLLFQKAINGEYRNEDRWISREDFFALKDTDPYVASCWSFGNDCQTYLYGKHIEPYKKALHYVVFFDDWALFDKLCPEVSDTCKIALNGRKNTKDRRIIIGRAVVQRLKEIGDESLLEKNALYNSCHRKAYRGLQSLQSLESLERLERLQGDYRDVIIPDNAVIYCDPPYKNTAKYTVDFDHEAFYDWAEKQIQPIFISEYYMPEDRFKCIAAKSKTCSLSATNNSVKTIEKIFIPKHQINNKPLTLFD